MCFAFADASNIRIHVHTYRLLREKKGKSTERRKETVELATSLLGSYIREAFQTPWLETHQLLLVVWFFFGGLFCIFHGCSQRHTAKRDEFVSCQRPTYILRTICTPLLEDFIQTAAVAFASLYTYSW